MPLPAKNGTKNPRYLILQDSYLLKDKMLHCKNDILDGWTAVPSNKSCINVWVFISPLLLSGAFPNSCIQPTRLQHDLLNKTVRSLCRPVTDADAIWSQMQSGHKCKCNLVTNANAIQSQMPMLVTNRQMCSKCISAKECEETPLSSVHTMTSFESSTITAKTWRVQV